MNLSIYLDDRTAAALKRVAARQKRTRNSLISEAIKRWLEQIDRSQWPRELLDWEGEPGLVPFETHRPRNNPKARFP